MKRIQIIKSVLTQNVFQPNGFESVKKRIRITQSIFKIDCLKKEWIRIYEEGFESYEEHQNFPENGFESNEKRFESVYEYHVFPEKWI